MTTIRVRSNSLSHLRPPTRTSPLPLSCLYSVLLAAAQLRKRRRRLRRRWQHAVERLWSESPERDRTAAPSARGPRGQNMLSSVYSKQARAQRAAAAISLFRSLFYCVSLAHHRESARARLSCTQAYIYIHRYTYT